MKQLLVILPLLALAACGTQTSAAEDPTTGEATGQATGTPAAVERPTEIPVADGPVTARAIVLDDGDGAVLCLGGVDTSLSPRCDGLPIEGWDWSAAPGEVEKARGVRWGEWEVTGTFDGTTFALTEAPAIPAPLGFDEVEPPLEPTVCVPPKEGWEVVDPEKTNEEAFDAALEAVAELPDVASVTVDRSGNPRSPEQAGPGIAFVTDWLLHVTVLEDPDRAEAVVREHWGGPLCVTTALYTEADLHRIQRELRDLPGMLSSGGGLNGIQVRVVYDDGSIQAWVDQEYGAGIVTVESALAPA